MFNIFFQSHLRVLFLRFDALLVASIGAASLGEQTKSNLTFFSHCSSSSSSKKNQQKQQRHKAEHDPLSLPTLEHCTEQRRAVESKQEKELYFQVDIVTSSLLSRCMSTRRPFVLFVFNFSFFYLFFSRHESTRKAPFGAIKPHVSHSSSWRCLNLTLCGV